MMKKITRTAAPVILAGLLIFGLSLAVSAQTRDTVNNLIARVLTVRTSATFNGPATFNDTAAFNSTTTFGALATMTTLAASGNTTVGGTFAVTGDTSLVADLNLPPQTALTITDGGVITPTGAMQRLTSAGNATATLAAPTSGQILILFNSAATVITIEDTTGQAFSSNVALGQWDTVTLMGYGNSWYELARSNN